MRRRPWQVVFVAFMAFGCCGKDGDDGTNAGAGSGANGGGGRGSAPGSSTPSPRVTRPGTPSLRQTSATPSGSTMMMDGISPTQVTDAEERGVATNGVTPEAEDPSTSAGDCTDDSAWACPETVDTDLVCCGGVTPSGCCNAACCDGDFCDAETGACGYECDELDVDCGDGNCCPMGAECIGDGQCEIAGECPDGTTACMYGGCCPSSGTCTGNLGEPPQCEVPAPCDADLVQCEDGSCCDAGATCTNDGQCEIRGCADGEVDCGSYCCMAGDTCADGDCQAPCPDGDVDCGDGTCCPSGTRCGETECIPEDQEPTTGACPTTKEECCGTSSGLCGCLPPVSCDCPSDANDDGPAKCGPGGGANDCRACNYY